jgi:hypothetical protein
MHIDLDPQIEGAAGFGWEAHFRSPDAQPGGHRNMTGHVYACDPTHEPTNFGVSCPTCTDTCWITGHPRMC